jgi:hypothetical protein
VRLHGTSIPPPLRILALAVVRALSPHTRAFVLPMANGQSNACVVVESGERLAVRVERAVRQCGKFPNEPVAPLRAGRQCKSLRLLQWCRTK